jgi:hypothetical protein
MLELFHGPTFAFKDVALQFLGNLFEHFLLQREARWAVSSFFKGGGGGGGGVALGSFGRKRLSIPLPLCSTSWQASTRSLLSVVKLQKSSRTSFLYRTQACKLNEETLPSQPNEGSLTLA